MSSPFVSEKVSRLLDFIEEGLRKFLDSDVELILKTGNYIVDGGGKRLRPLLTLLLAAGGGLGEKELKERIVPLAVGIEYIHTASLLHDDVVDEADTRRGRPAAHKIFGNSVAVLTGDYMYANALYLYSIFGTPKMIEVVSSAVKKMAEGQLLELKRVGDLIDEREYFKIIDGKTGVLFAAAAAVGALASERLKDEYERWWDFGLALGRAFQLIDDALDYTGDDKKLGKPAGQDLREGKTTYPLLAVLEHLDKGAVQKVLRSFNPGDATRLVEEINNLGGVEKTKKRARVELQKALEVINGSKITPEVGEILKSLVEFVVERTY
jgi:octaprenyl-diphosphate synthase